MYAVYNSLTSIVTFTMIPFCTFNFINNIHEIKRGITRYVSLTIHVYMRPFGFRFERGTTDTKEIVKLKDQKYPDNAMA